MNLIWSFSDYEFETYEFTKNIAFICLCAWQNALYEIFKKANWFAS